MADIYAWQRPTWRQFSYNAPQFVPFETQFQHFAGVVVGVQMGLSDEDKEAVNISFLLDEAAGTSEIEGELLDRNSLQSSIQRYFDLKPPLDKNRPRENGIAQMMVDLYQQFDAPLSHHSLFQWHQMLMNGRTDLDAIGQYRSHIEPMQIVSGQLDKPNVHYQAPPSDSVHEEMTLFIDWFNHSSTSLPSLIRAGIAHLYFELIHPFEDGNGRIGRALIEKSLAQSLGQPTLIAVSQKILSKKRAYYDALEAANKSNDVTDWLVYFCTTIIEAQQFTIESMRFLLRKARFFDQYQNMLNDRQNKLIQRIFREGLGGFAGGVSVSNSMKITKASAATANRDLNDLVNKGIMQRTGQFKSTRYWLVLPE